MFIRPERTADTAAIHALTAMAFASVDHSSHTEHLIIDALRRDGQLTVSLVAEDEGEVIGHVAVSPVAISDGATGWFGLGPISVLPNRQGEGVGAALMWAAVQALRQAGAQGCVVLGDPGFYSRFGFRPESKLILPDVPAPYFQALRLADYCPSGMVTYHQVFTNPA